MKGSSHLLKSRLRAYVRSCLRTLALVPVLLAFVPVFGADSNSVEFTKLTGELAGYTEVFCSEDGEVILTREFIDQGTISFYIFNESNLNSYRSERLDIQVKADDNIPVHIANMKKYNGFWYVHLQGDYEYIYRCLFFNRSTERMYSGPIDSKHLPHHDFYISDSGTPYLYRWASARQSPHVVEVNRVKGDSLIPVLRLPEFVPEGIVFLSQNYKCIDMYNDAVFIFDPTDGSVIRFSDGSQVPDTLRRPKFPLTEKQKHTAIQLRNRYVRSSTFKNYDKLVELEDQLTRYERIYVLNDSILVLNAFSHKNGHHDSLIFYNYQKKSLHRVYANAWNFSDSMDVNTAHCFTLYYQKWATSGNRIFIQNRFRESMDDPEVQTVGELFRIGPREQTYLWSVKLNLSEHDGN